MKKLILYFVALAASVAIALLVVHFGSGLGAASIEPTSVMSPWQTFLTTVHQPLSQLLMQVVVIVTAARLAGSLFTRYGQPAVIGEMFVGVALGPSLFGALTPDVSHFIFPADKGSLINLSMLSQVGILLFMFVVGMELDTKLLRQKAHAALVISHMSIVVPFILGLAAALWLYTGYAGAHTPFIAFALFLGISMSITAFPILARIIQERGLTGSALGTTAVTCAAVDDVTAWCGLAFIVAVSRAQSLAGCAVTVACCVLFLAFMLLAVRPMLERMVDRLEDPANPGKNSVVVALVTVFSAALFTEAIGIHALFGAFIAGVSMSTNEEFRHFLRTRIEYFATLFLLPIFFAFTGLRTQVGLLHGSTDWLVAGLLLFLAVAGKFGGGALAAKFTGMSWRESTALGALMNTRGLMELIALNLGLDLGVLSPKVFAMLVLMALVTTFSTGPVLQALGIGTLVTERRSPTGKAVPV